MSTLGVPGPLESPRFWWIAAGCVLLVAALRVIVVSRRGARPRPPRVGGNAPPEGRLARLARQIRNADESQFDNTAVLTELRTLAVETVCVEQGLEKDVAMTLVNQGTWTSDPLLRGLTSLETLQNRSGPRRSFADPSFRGRLGMFLERIRSGTSVALPGPQRRNR